MKVNELIAQAGKNRSVDVSKLVETKAYLPMEEKKALIKRILDKCTVNEEGVTRINGVDQYVAFTMYTIGAYTNLEFEDDYVAEYDALCESGMLGAVVATFDGEYKTVLNLLELEKKYVLESNSIEAQVGKFLNGILVSIDGVLGALAKQAESFDMSKLPISEEDIAKLGQFLGKVK